MGTQIIIIEYFKVLWVFVILSTSGQLFSRTIILDISSKNTHLFIEVTHVIKVVKLA